MAKEITPRRPTTRRRTKEEKDQAVRLVFELRKKLGTTLGTVVRIADQLGYGTESVRRWVADAEIEAGDTPDMSAVERLKMKKLEQENRELWRSNENLKTASAGSGGTKSNGSTGISTTSPQPNSRTPTMPKGAANS